MQRNDLKVTAQNPVQLAKPTVFVCDDLKGFANSVHGMWKTQSARLAQQIREVSENKAGLPRSNPYWQAM